MARRPRRFIRASHNWRAVAVSISVITVILLAALSAAGIVKLSVNGSAARPVDQSIIPAPSGFTTASCDWCSQGAQITCQAAFDLGTLFTLGVYSLTGPGCGELSGSPSITAVNTANEAVSMQNIVTSLDNYLNITNSAVAGLNATFQELLSYYESRAESIIPFYLNGTWNSTVYDQVAIDSGLVPSIEGMELALAKQQYQDWNATANSWDLAFGSAGTFAADAATLGFVLNQSGTYPSGKYAAALAINGHNVVTSAPFEYLGAPGNNQSTVPADQAFAGPSSIYLNLMPGGTLVCAAFKNVTVATDCGNYTVKDITTGQQYAIPNLNFTSWFQGSIPAITKTHPIGQFDLLKVSCTASCTGLKFLEMSGGYAFENISQYANLVGGDPYNAMYPVITLTEAGTAYPNAWFVPDGYEDVCIANSVNPNGGAACSTSLAHSEGSSQSVGTGAGAVVGGPYTLTMFAPTMQHLLNNSMTMAYDYYLTLRAITDSARYSIPPNCVIPPPSDAFPAATDFAQYMLSANNVEGVYLAYLDAVARAYGQTFTDSAGFCGNSNLGFAFNWSSAWHLQLNITASVWVANSSGPIYLNGTPDKAATYSDVSTWPVYNVDPALIYPVDYQMNVPLDTIYPLPVNDPVSAVLVNFPGNLYYGQTTLSPNWGVPTYLSLFGNGNYIGVSGDLSGTASGSPPSSADAIMISSCVYKGIPEPSSCNISATYFNNFTFGLVHSILPPVQGGSGGGGGGIAGNSCGFGALNQWYDGWAGNIGSALADTFSYVGNLGSGIPLIGTGWSYFWSGLGCVIAWIVLIIIFFVLAYVFIAVARWAYDAWER